MPSDKGLDYGALVEKYVDCGASLHLEYQDASLLRFNLFSCLQRAQLIQACIMASGYYYTNSISNDLEPELCTGEIQHWLLSCNSKTVLKSVNSTYVAVLKVLKTPNK